MKMPQFESSTTKNVNKDNAVNDLKGVVSFKKEITVYICTLDWLTTTVTRTFSSSVSQVFFLSSISCLQQSRPNRMFGTHFA